GLGSRAAALGILAFKTSPTALARHPFLIAITALLSLITPLILRFADLGESVEDANDPLDEQAKAQKRLQELMKSGAPAITEQTAAIREQAAALKQLSDEERQYLALSDQRGARDAVTNKANELRIRGIDEAIALAGESRTPAQKALEEALKRRE